MKFDIRTVAARLAGVAAALALVGCATVPQEPVQLNAATSLTGARVGVVMTPIPNADTHLPGAGCLLCLAAASVANSSLTSHAKTLTPEDLPQLKDQVAAALKKKGVEAIVIAEPLDLKALPDAANRGPNLASKDFSSVQKKHGVDKVLVIDITTLGFVRTYSAYVPTSEPKGTVQGTGYLVNLKTGAYEWYLPINVTKSADGPWDEAPKFPGLTNAYYQAIELSKDSVLKPFGG
jgi:hypothetical protein